MQTTHVPAAWMSLVFDHEGGLVAGFGDRFVQAPRESVRVRQVHGADVVACDELTPGPNLDVAADGLIVTRPGAVAAVQTADCVPILLVAAPRTQLRWAAAVHAGWRGTVAGVVAAALACARKSGIAVEDLLAALGPSIGSCCYEVGEDVATHFRRMDLPVADGGARPRLDLRAIHRELLIRSGLAPDNVVLCGPCTRCRSDRYHSHRAASDRAGRQSSWIGWAV